MPLAGGDHLTDVTLSDVKSEKRPSALKGAQSIPRVANLGDAIALRERVTPRIHVGASVATERPRGLLSGAELKTGCVPWNDALDQALNRGLAILIFMAALPAFLAVAGAVLIFSGRPIFYAGPRLGKDRKLFDILKFRTLDTGTASKVTANKTLPRRNLTVTKIGHYLRLSRLDELPQLINIMRGDMVFFGPRPVRPEVEGIYEVGSAAHMSRFAVRPGLVGMSQAIMTHETPKPVRARFNRMVCRTPIRYRYLLGFVALVGYHVALKSVRVAYSAVIDRFSPLRDHNWLLVGFNRPRQCRIELQVGPEVVWGAVSGAADELIQFVTVQPIEPGAYNAEVILKRRGRGLRRARMQLQVFASQPRGIGQNGFAQFCHYDVGSQYSRHVVERYLLQSAVISA